MEKEKQLNVYITKNAKTKCESYTIYDEVEYSNGFADILVFKDTKGTEHGIRLEYVSLLEIIGEELPEEFQQDANGTIKEITLNFEPEGILNEKIYRVNLEQNDMTIEDWHDTLRFKQFMIFVDTNKNIILFNTQHLLRYSIA